MGHSPAWRVLAFLWVTALTVGQGYLWLESRWDKAAELDRVGLTYEPQVFLRITDDNRCELKNTGIRPISEVTLLWQWYFVNTTRCTIELAAVSSSSAWPVGETRELAPRGVLSIAHSGGRETVCQSPARPTPENCPSSECKVVVECAAEYHHPMTLRPYRESRFAIALLADPLNLEPDCKIKTIDAFFRSMGDHLEWDDEVAHHTWICLNRSRSRFGPDPKQPWYERHRLEMLEHEGVAASADPR